MADIIFSLNAVLSLRMLVIVCIKVFKSAPYYELAFKTLNKKFLRALRMFFNLSLDISIPSFSISFDSLSKSKFP
jgi:hypothetical protein